jgi:hypothetical protein
MSGSFGYGGNRRSSGGSEGQEGAGGGSGSAFSAALMNKDSGFLPDDEFALLHPNLSSGANAGAGFLRLSPQGLSALSDGFKPKSFRAMFFFCPFALINGL